MATYFEPPHIVDHKSYINYRKRGDTKFIVVHCAATQNKQVYDWKTIDQMHRQKGWTGIGYHYVIRTDGTIETGRPREALGAHVSGYNDVSLGICLIGGVDSKGRSIDNFTREQKESLRLLIDWLKSFYPDAEVLGHRDFPDVHKDCPCFDVKEWYGKGAKYIRYVNQDSLSKCKLSQADLKRVNGTLSFNEGDIVRIA